MLGPSVCHVLKMGESEDATGMVGILHKQALHPNPWSARPTGWKTEAMIVSFEPLLDAQLWYRILMSVNRELIAVF